MHLWFLEETEQLKELLLVLLRYAYPGVFDLYLKKLVYDPYSNVDLSILCEFKGVALQAKKDLHDSLLVCIHHVRMFIPQKLMRKLMVLIILCNIFKSCKKFDFVVLSLPLLY